MFARDYTSSIRRVYQLSASQDSTDGSYFARLHEKYAPKVMNLLVKQGLGRLKDVCTYVCVCVCFMCETYFDMGT